MADRREGGPVSVPPSRSSRRTAPAGDAALTAAAGVWGLIRVVFAIVVLAVIGFGIWGYQHAHTPEFRLQCAAYQAHIVSMGFPDNALCLMFWNS